MTAILSATLAPPSTASRGRAGCSRISDRVFTSRFQQATGGRRQQVGDPLGAGVRAVGGAEGVVHVHVGERRQLAGQLGVVALLARLEADVLEQHQLPVLESLGELADGLSRRRPGRASRARPGAPAGGPATGAIESAGSGLAAGPAEVRDEDQPRAAAAQLFDRGQRRADARVVG